MEPTTALREPRALGASGLLVALPEELGELAQRCTSRFQRGGLELLELEGVAPEGARVLAAVGGVGKVRAARAAALLCAQGIERLFIAGVCGALAKSLGPGDLVHCTRAAQTDLAVRDGRELDADRALADAWYAVAPGARGWFLTADRPVFSLWRRARLARAFAGPCVADMETAAAASVATLAGVPWAALRAVTDRADALGVAAFRKHFPVQAGRAARTLPALLERLAAVRGAQVETGDPESGAPGCFER